MLTSKKLSNANVLYLLHAHATSKVSIATYIETILIPIRMHMHLHVHCKHKSVTSFLGSHRICASMAKGM